MHRPSVQIPPSAPKIAEMARLPGLEVLAIKSTRTKFIRILSESVLF